MAAAIESIRQNVAPSDLLFTDYQTDLILGHYLCRERPIVFDAAPPDFEQFSCAGYRVVSTDYKTAGMFLGNNFPGHLHELVQAYNLKRGNMVWVVQAGWDIDLPGQLRAEDPEFHDLKFESFGDNIKIFKWTIQ
jgi:hypothetical protein